MSDTSRLRWGERSRPMTMPLQHRLDKSASNTVGLLVTQHGTAPAMGTTKRKHWTYLQVVICWSRVYTRLLSGSMLYVAVRPAHGKHMRRRRIMNGGHCHATCCSTAWTQQPAANGGAGGGRGRTCVTVGGLEVDGGVDEDGIDQLRHAHVLQHLRPPAPTLSVVCSPASCASLNKNKLAYCWCMPSMVPHACCNALCNPGALYLPCACTRC